MRATIAGFKNFVEHYKYVLAIAALMVGPATIVLGWSISYYRGTINDLRIEHADEVQRYRAEVDFERTINREILYTMQEHLDELTKRLGLAAVKVEDAADSANRAAENAAAAAAAIPDPAAFLAPDHETRTDTPTDGATHEEHCDNCGPLKQ